MTTPTIALENSIGPSFELMQDGTMFVPYGDFQHPEGLQRFDREGAQRIADDLRGIFSQIRRVIQSRVPRRAPIYIGHPDVPGRGPEFPDKRAYGWITSATAENDGMRVSVKWTRAGDELVREGHFRFYSPYWELEERRDGRSRVLHPVMLISMGLTNNPRIPVPALANDDSAAAGDDQGEEDSTNGSETDPDDTMKKELAALLGKDETTADEDLLAMVKTLMENQKPAEGAASEEEPAKTDEAEEDPEMKAAENDALVQVRRERVGAAVDALCLAGRVTVADRATVTDRLLACANDDAAYGAELERLRTGAPVLKTAGVTDDLAESGGAVRAENDKAAIKQRRQELMDAEMRANGGNFNAAWTKLSRAKPELFV